MEICSRCEKIRELKHGSGLCASCYVRAHYRTGICTTCKQEKPIHSKGVCQRCLDRSPEKKARKNELRRKAYAENAESRERAKVSRRLSYAKAGLNTARKRNRFHMYGLTPEGFQALFAAQDFSCAVCRRILDEDAPKKYHRPHVDHCHTSGQARQILCGYCNFVLGGSFENSDVLRALAAYVDVWHKTLR